MTFRPGRGPSPVPGGDRWHNFTDCLRSWSSSVPLILLFHNITITDGDTISQTQLLTLLLLPGCQCHSPPPDPARQPQIKQAGKPLPSPLFSKTSRYHHYFQKHHSITIIFSNLGGYGLESAVLFYFRVFFSFLCSCFAVFIFCTLQFFVFYLKILELWSKCLSGEPGWISKKRERENGKFEAPPKFSSYT